MIVVTGGAGFIGSALIRELNKQGREDILVVDYLGDEDKWLNLRDLKIGDIMGPEDFLQVSKWPSSIDIIYHLGACSDTTESDMDYLLNNNFSFSKEIAKLAFKSEAVLCYASSAATYGDGSLGYSDDLLEQLEPLNKYAYSKILFDLWISKAHQKPKHWYGLRFFNVFGPNEYHKNDMQSVVRKSFDQIQETGQAKLFKSYKDDVAHGEQKRDFVYVKDSCRAMTELIKAKAPSGIYNLGTGQASSFKALTEAVFKALNKECHIDYVDMPPGLDKRYQYYTKAEMDKFHKYVANFKFTSLEDAIDDYVKNYLLQEHPYLKVVDNARV